MNVLLQVKNLSLATTDRFGREKQIVSELSFNLFQKETLAIVGESGAGKSLTVGSILGLLPKDVRMTSGSILFDGIELSNNHTKGFEKVRGKRISLILQDPMTSLDPLSSVGEQIKLPVMKHLGLGKTESKEKVNWLLEKVGLSNPKQIYNQYPYQLSGGQRQRAMIALALSCGPDLLIADEPTTALDALVQRQIISLLKNLQHEFGMSILLVTHDLGVVWGCAHRVAVMKDGVIRELGETKQIFSNPSNPYTKGLIACRPPVEFRPSRLATVEDFLKGARIPPATAVYCEDGKPPLLKIENISKVVSSRNSFFSRKSKVSILDRVSIEVQEGKSFGLVGESGCGKSTLAKIISGIDGETSGEIYYEGRLLNWRTCSRSVRKEIQYIFQDSLASLNPYMTVKEILEEPLLIHGCRKSPEERHSKIVELLERVGLDPSLIHRFPRQFSGGQRQRICIARALILEPKLIICDESVSALDVSIQAKILNLLMDLKRDLSITFMFISHDMNIIQFFCDDIAIMSQGRIIEFGTVDEIFQSPREGLTANLVESTLEGAPQDVGQTLKEVYDF